MVLVLHLSILYDHSSLLFLFSFFLAFALYNIHVFHARLFLLILFNNKNKKIKNKKEENEGKMSFVLFFLNLKSRLAILSLHNMFMYLV